jgi:hypothetical protein
MGLRDTKYLLFKIAHNYVFEINAETCLDLQNMPNDVRGLFVCNEALISITTRTISKRDRYRSVPFLVTTRRDSWTQGPDTAIMLPLT